MNEEQAKRSIRHSISLEERKYKKRNHWQRSEAKNLHFHFIFVLIYGYSFTCSVFQRKFCENGCDNTNSKYTIWWLATSREEIKTEEEVEKKTNLTNYVLHRIIASFLYIFRQYTHTRLVHEIDRGFSQFFVFSLNLLVIYGSVRFLTLLSEKICNLLHSIWFRVHSMRF